MQYDNHVFINCPFDEEYRPLFRALVFVVHQCGYVARCALEVDDGSQVRIDKIKRIIEESRYGIHDISRTELDRESGLPRFNMPLELGLFLGAKRFGSGQQRSKACIIFDRERWRYQKYISDIAGHDIRAHRGEEEQVIRGVRDALRSWQPERTLPGGAEMCIRYRRFVEDMPAAAARLRLDAREATFSDLSTLVAEWLKANEN